MAPGSSHLNKKNLWPGLHVLLLTEKYTSDLLSHTPTHPISVSRQTWTMFRTAQHGCLLSPLRWTWYTHKTQCAVWQNTNIWGLSCYTLNRGAFSGSSQMHFHAFYTLLSPEGKQGLSTIGDTSAVWSYLFIKMSPFDGIYVHTPTQTFMTA